MGLFIFKLQKMILRNCREKDIKGVLWCQNEFHYFLKRALLLKWLWLFSAQFIN